MLHYSKRSKYAIPRDSYYTILHCSVWRFALYRLPSGIVLHIAASSGTAWQLLQLWHLTWTTALQITCSQCSTASHSLLLGSRNCTCGNRLRHQIPGDQSHKDRLIKSFHTNSLAALRKTCLDVSTSGERFCLGAQRITFMLRSVTLASLAVHWFWLKITYAAWRTIFSLTKGFNKIKQYWSCNEKYLIILKYFY